MREMKDETVYVTGESRTSVENAITKTYGAFYVAFEINGRTGEIVEADCSGTLELTRSFVRRMFVGKRILEDDQKIEEEIRRRYFGSSVKALLVAYRDARKRFGQIQEEDRFDRPPGTWYDVVEKSVSGRGEIPHWR